MVLFLFFFGSEENFFLFIEEGFREKYFIIVFSVGNKNGYVKEVWLEE